MDVVGRSPGQLAWMRLRRDRVAIVSLAILAGFAFNRRVMIQGYHGTGKSTHIEQVAARLNWPCIRVNLDSHISRIDLIGKDAIVIKDGAQVTDSRAPLWPALNIDVAR